jgi:hypothetical protein
MKDTGVVASYQATTPAPNDQRRTWGRPRSCGLRRAFTAGFCLRRLHRELTPSTRILPCSALRSLQASTMPSADFCRPVGMDHSTLSPESGTDGRSPEVSSTAFGAQPPGLQPAPLMDMDFAVMCPLVRYRMPHTRFLSIGSPLCSTLLSDPVSRRRPCASL